MKEFDELKNIEL